MKIMESNPLGNYGKAIVVGITTFLVSYTIMKMLNRRKSRTPPGLPSVPILGSIPFLPKVMGHLAFTDLAKKYGDIYQLFLGPGRMVVLNTFDLLNEAFIKNTADLSDRPAFYVIQQFNPENKGIIEPSPSEEWKKTRNTALSILKDFGFGRNLMEARIATETNALVEQFERHLRVPYDPDEDITISVSNVINSILFNKRFSYDDMRFKEQLSVMDDLFVSTIEATIINVFPMFRFFPGGRAAWKKNKNHATRWLAFLRKEISDHNAETDSNDVESDFISAYKFKTGGDIGEEDILQLVKDFFAAGTETTATTIKWALIRFANQPDIMKEIQKEIDLVIGDSRSPRLTDKPQMTYTEAFTLELLRHSSIVFLALPHCAARDTEVGGYIIPKGTAVIPNVWAVNRNEKEWPCADKFDPSRFLDTDGNVINNDRIVSFGVGKRSCLGEALARQELFMFLTSLLQRFDFSLPPGVDELSEEPVFGVTLAPKHFKICISPRY